MTDHEAYGATQLCIARSTFLTNMIQRQLKERGMGEATKDTLKIEPGAPLCSTLEQFIELCVDMVTASPAAKLLLHFDLHARVDIAVFSRLWNDKDFRKKIKDAKAKLLRGREEPGLAKFRSWTESLQAESVWGQLRTSIKGLLDVYNIRRERHFRRVDT